MFCEKNLQVPKLLTHMCTLLSNLSKLSIRWKGGGREGGEALFKSGLCFLPSFLLCNPSFSRSLSLLSICPGAAFAPPNGFLIPSLDHACSPLQGVLKYLDTPLYNAQRQGALNSDLPVVLYGCENWSLTIKLETRQKAFGNKFLRSLERRSKKRIKKIKQRRT